MRPTPPGPGTGQKTQPHQQTGWQRRLRMPRRMPRQAVLHGALRRAAGELKAVTSAGAGREGDVPSLRGRAGWRLGSGSLHPPQDTGSEWRERGPGGRGSSCPQSSRRERCPSPRQAKHPRQALLRHHVPGHQNSVATPIQQPLPQQWAATPSLRPSVPCGRQSVTAGGGDRRDKAALPLGLRGTLGQACT